MKTRILAALLCLCLLFTTLPLTALAAETVTGTVYGLNDGVPLRVRSTPVDGKVVDQIYNDDVVTILATSEDGQWYQVLTPNGVTGWSSVEFIRINEPDTLPRPLPKVPPAPSASSTTVASYTCAASRMSRARCWTSCKTTTW